MVVGLTEKSDECSKAIGSRKHLTCTLDLPGFWPTLLHCFKIIPDQFGQIDITAFQEETTQYEPSSLIVAYWLERATPTRPIAVRNQLFFISDHVAEQPLNHCGLRQGFWRIPPRRSRSKPFYALVQRTSFGLVQRKAYRMRNSFRRVRCAVTKKIVNEALTDLSLSEVDGRKNARLIFYVGVN